MRSLAIENFRRSELERWIDDAIEDVRVYAPAYKLLAGENGR